MRMAQRVLVVAVLVACAFAAVAEEAPCLTGRNGATVCPEPQGKCLKNRRGDVLCSRPQGGISFDRNGEPVCGVGRCTIDGRGNTMCSTVPGGTAAMNALGVAECTGSCAPANAATCAAPGNGAGGR